MAMLPRGGWVRVRPGAVPLESAGVWILKQEGASGILVDSSYR